MADTTPDPFRLQRFVDAQNGIFSQVCAELRNGEKRSHWMWFIFPQIKGLGSSSMAAKFAIGSLDEARAYLAHDVLGPRLRQCTELVLDVRGRSVDRIFGYPDDLKFHSSMTLFAQVQGEPLFARALDTYFAGKPDQGTLARL